MNPRRHIRVCSGAITVSAALISFALPTAAWASGMPADAANVQPAAEYAEHAATQLVSHLSASVPATPTISSPVSAVPAAAPVVAPQPPPIAAPAPVAAVAASAPAPRVVTDSASDTATVSDRPPPPPVAPAPHPSGAAIHPPSSPDRTGSDSPAVATASGDAAAGGSSSAPDRSPARTGASSQTSAAAAAAADPATFAVHPNFSSVLAGLRAIKSDAAVVNAVTLRMQQMLTDIESRSWPVSLLGRQLSTKTSLGAQLERLIAGVHGSARGDQPVTAFPVSPPGHGRPQPDLASAQRPQASMAYFVGSNGRVVEPPQPSTGVVNQPQKWWAPARGNTAVPVRGAVTLLSTPIHLAGAGAPRGSDKSHRARRPRGSPVQSSVTAAIAPPISPTLPASAAASGAGGGLAAGAAGALLMAAALWLLQALLPGRLALDLFPWKSTLLALRLERPG